MAIVSNSSPLILYARIGRLHLLRELFGEVLVPPAVWREVVIAGTGRMGAREVQEAGWIYRVPLPDNEVPPRLAVLDLGEAEAITLATRLGPAATIVLDDRRGRRLARDFGLVVIGSAGLLGRAKEVGLIPFVQPSLLELRSAGLFLGDASMRDLLDNSGE